jgi:hypothetical protein
MPIYAASNSQNLPETILTAPAAISLTASPNPALTTQGINLSGNLTRTDTGQGIDGATVLIQVSADAKTWTTLTTVQTSMGVFSAVIQRTNAGTYFLQAVFAGTGMFKAMISNTVTENVIAPTVASNLTMTVNPDPALPNQTITISGQLTRLDNNSGIGNAPVQILTSTDGVTFNMTPGYATTDTDGNYSFTLSYPTPLTIYFQAMFGGQII